MRLTEQERAALHYMAELYFEDAGPTGQGWKSDESLKAQAVLAALAEANRTCATCKWADRDHGNLACDRVHDAASQAFIVGPDDTPVRLHVAPDFGCVQWEAA